VSWRRPMVQRPSLRVRREHGITFFEFHPPNAVFSDKEVRHFRQHLLAAVDQSPDLCFIVDFTDVQYMSSSVLGVLVSALIKVQGRGGRLRITGVTRDLKDLFRLTGMERLFHFSETPQAALRSLATREEVGE
jgi:anti-anti-sigma factor